MLHTIQSDIMGFAHKYLLQGIVFATVSGSAIFLCLFLYLYRKQQSMKSALKGKYHKAVLWYLLLLYFYMVLAITLFSRTPSCLRQPNWQLFSTFGTTQWQRVFIFENILMFVPLGILLYLLSKNMRKLYRAWIVGFATSLLIETAQYITCLGSFQVDDIFNNVLGMTIGYGVGEVVKGVGAVVRRKGN